MRAKASPWVTRFYLIRRVTNDRHIRAMEINLVQFAGCKTYGYRWYEFRDAKARTLTYIAVQTLEPCRPFTDQCYDWLKENKWEGFIKQL